VVAGFTLGIAVIIFLQHVPAALGFTRPDGENTAVVAADAAGDAIGSGSLAAEAWPTPPRHDPDRELFGQGLANIVSPLFGGMPATGATARTAVTVSAGARTISSRRDGSSKVRSR